MHSPQAGINTLLWVVFFFGVLLILSTVMQVETLIILSLAFLFISFLYSSVGHAGAAGYLVVMVLCLLHWDQGTLRELKSKILLAILCFYSLASLTNFIEAVANRELKISVILNIFCRCVECFTFCHNGLTIGVKDILEQNIG